MNTDPAERLKGLLGRIGKVRLIVITGIAGMVLILLSGLLADSGTSAQTQPEPQQSVLCDAETYRADLETRLTALLSRMDGVGSVTVMVTVGGSAEQVYAQEVKRASSDHSVQTEYDPVLARHGSDESAVIAETRYPAVTGAAILCTGGGHAAVRERVVQAATAVLGIPSNQVYVGAGV